MRKSDMDTIKNVVKALGGVFSSKKMLAAIISGVVAVAARYGFDLDPELVGLVVAAFVAAIFGQGLADHGKEAARINAESRAGEVKSAANQTSQLSLLLVVFFAAAAPASGCGAVRSGAGAASASYIDCMTPDLKTAYGELLPAMSEALKTTLSGSGSLDRERFKSIASPLKAPAARCAMKAAVDGLIAAVKQGDVSAAPPAVDVGALSAAMEETRAVDWGGVEIRGAR